jgi:hypothetical protein
MRLHQAKLLFGLALISLFFSACVSKEKANINSNSAPVANSNSTATLVAKDDIDELGKIIKLPATPEEATYNEFNPNDQNAPTNTSHSSEKKFVAVLRFSQDDANQIASKAEKYKTPAPADIDAETWFPPELVAKSQETGDSALKGVEYAANDFLQTPFTGGKLTRINDTNYFVLELNAS